MEGTMRNAILCCLTLCLSTGAASGILAAQDDNAPYAEVAAPTLIKRLADTGDEHKFAASALRRFGSESAPFLRAALYHESELVRVRAAALLWDISKDHVAVNALAAGLGSSDWQVQREAVRAIRDIGPDAEMAIPALVAAFKSPLEEVRLLAEKALVRLGSRSHRFLLSALQDNNERVRMHAVSALGFLPDQYGSSLPSL